MPFEFSQDGKVNSTKPFGDRQMRSGEWHIESGGG
jgi:hypothetical protein